MIQTNSAICNSKKSRFIKEQLAKGLLSNLGIKTPLNKVPLLNILSDCNGIRTHNHLVRKRTLNHLAKLAK